LGILHLFVGYTDDPVLAASAASTRRVGCAQRGLMLGGCRWAEHLPAATHVLPDRAPHPLQPQQGRAGLRAERQRHHDDPVVVGHISALAIDRERERDLALILAIAPLAVQHLLQALVRPAPLARDDQAPIRVDCHRDIFRLETGHQ
jgi:hypothetical protein